MFSLKRKLGCFENVFVLKTYTDLQTDSGEIKF